MASWEGLVCTHIRVRCFSVLTTVVVNGKAFTDSFDSPDATMIGLIVAIYEVGCFFGAVITAAVGEQLGRRKSIGAGVIVMIIGAVLQATSYSRAQVRLPRCCSRELN